MLKLTVEFVIITRTKTTKTELVMIQTLTAMAMLQPIHMVILAVPIGAMKVGAADMTQTISTLIRCVVPVVVVNLRMMTMAMMVMMAAMTAAMMAVTIVVMMELHLIQLLSYCKSHQMQKQLPLL